MRLLKLFIIFQLLVFTAVFNSCDSERFPDDPQPSITYEPSIVVSAEFEAVAYDSTKTSGITGTYDGTVKNFSVLNTSYYPIDYSRTIEKTTGTYDVGWTATKDSGTMWLEGYDDIEYKSFGLLINGANSMVNYLEASPDDFGRTLVTGAYFITKDCVLYESSKNFPGTTGKIFLDFKDETGYIITKYQAGDLVTGTFELLMVYRGIDADCKEYEEQVNGPEEISFKDDIMPTFVSLGCTASACHTKNDDAGGLFLAGSIIDVHTETLSVVDLDNPEASLLLSEALAEDEGGTRHPNEGKVFQSIYEDTYMLWLRWIEEGAENN